MTHPDRIGPLRPAAWRLAVRYVLFAVIATVANLGAQRLVFVLADHEFRFALALGTGTGVGLVTKYVLDKKWIFMDRRRRVAEETRMFTLYTLTGVGTTLIFWGAESLAWAVWGTRSAREAGAILGLAAGYAIKYRLDRRYVFGG